MFMMVDFVREMTVKSCKYGKCGSYAHLLFLFFLGGWWVFFSVTVLNTSIIFFVKNELNVKDKCQW